ncbi:MAG TPA: hypothetical protein VIT91_13255 [Chthoniobacterales bacterium]
MGDTFDLNHEKLAGTKPFAGLAGQLSKQSRIDSRASFNQYCREACRLWGESFPNGVGKTSAKFTELLEQIAKGGDGIIPTPWGGVVVTVHEHPRVEKYLVIRKGGYLALEKHDEKDERLEVVEGAGIILSRRASDQPLAVQTLAPGDQFHFEPGMEHCMIGTEDLLVFERSTDPKGMDQDLIFIYEPDGTA